MNSDLFFFTGDIGMTAKKKVAKVTAKKKVQVPEARKHRVVRMSPSVEGPGPVGFRNRPRIRNALKK